MLGGVTVSEGWLHFGPVIPTASVLELPSFVPPDTPEISSASLAIWLPAVLGKPHHHRLLRVPAKIDT